MATLSFVRVGMEYFNPRTSERTRALEEVSFAVDEGEFVAIVGPSGCGKSTLLNVVAGLVMPSTGRVELHGRRVEGSGRDRAMVFQDAALLPWLTVLGNVAYGLRCHGVGREPARRAASEYISLVRLDGFEGRYPHELSGGMQQRVNLARALAVDPAVLLMDEPFAALDPLTREVMQAELLRIWGAARKTVLFVTHQMDEAIYLSDRVVVLSARPGRILDDVHVAITRPRSLEEKRTEAFLRYEKRIWGHLGAQIAAASGGRDPDLDRDTEAGSG